MIKVLQVSQLTNFVPYSGTSRKCKGIHRQLALVWREPMAAHHKDIELLRAAIIELQKRVGSLEGHRAAAEALSDDILATLAEIIALQYRLEKLLKESNANQEP